MLSRMKNGKNRDKINNRLGVTIIMTPKMERSTENFIIGMPSMIQEGWHQKVGTFLQMTNGLFL